MGGAIWGDLDRDGDVDYDDAMLALQVAVGLVSEGEGEGEGAAEGSVEGEGAGPVCGGDIMLRGDLNGDKVIDSADALLILRLAGGLPINPGEKHAHRAKDFEGLRRLSMPDKEIPTGCTFTLPVYLDNAASVAGMDLVVSFPKTELECTNVHTTHDTGRFEIESSRQGGYVRLSMGETGSLEAGPTTMVQLEFLVLGEPTDDTMNPAPRVRMNYAELKGDLGESFRWYTDVEKGDCTIRILPAGPCTTDCHAADQDCDRAISLSELLRIIQLYNSGGYHCDSAGEDGYGPGAGSTDCSAHNADYAPADWTINLSELLRVIQFYNSGAYHACPTGEDGFCPGEG